MSMKLSRRDQVGILIAIVIVVVLAGIFLLLKPQYENMQASNDRLVAKQKEKQELEDKIATLEDLKKTLEKNVNEVVKVQDQFINENLNDQTYQISSYLMALLEPSGLDITGVSLENLASTRLEEYTYNKRALAYPMKISSDLAHKLPEEVYYAYNGSYPTPGPSATVAGTNVTIQFQCDLDFQQVYDAIDIIANHEKNIYLFTAGAGTGYDPVEEGVEIAAGELVITVYEITPMDPADLDS